MFQVLSQGYLETPGFVVFFAPNPKQTFGAGLISIGPVRPEFYIAIMSKPGGDQLRKASIDMNFIANTKMDVMMTPTDSPFSKKQQW